MSNIEIYTRPGCGYCTHAKRLLNNKGLVFTEYDVYQHPHNRSYPQIFINDVSVGGFEDLLKLDQQHRLMTATPLTAING